MTTLRSKNIWRLERRAFRTQELASLLLECFYSKKLIPYVTGAALKGEGVAELLNLLAALAPFADEEEGPLSGVVFKVEHNPTLGRVAHVRLFSGELKNRDAVKCSPSGAEGKVDADTRGAGGEGARHGAAPRRRGRRALRRSAHSLRRYVRRPVARAASGRNVRASAARQG